MLRKQGENHPELIQAALMHDVGKLRYPLNPVERAVVVLAQKLIPGRAHRWGILPSSGWEALPGWRKAFIVAALHAEWGAQMAHVAGASSLAESLIRQHHHELNESASEVENCLLHALWVADNES